MHACLCVCVCADVCGCVCVWWRSGGGKIKTGRLYEDTAALSL